MHLWPSVRIRDSFKIAYLRKLEWNLHRMKSEKQSSSSPRTPTNQQKLLDDQETANSSEPASSKLTAGLSVIFGEISMVLSCCFCCFCCGACVDHEDN